MAVVRRLLLHDVVSAFNTNLFSDLRVDHFSVLSRFLLPFFSCKAHAENAPGCCPVSTTGVPVDIKVHIDSDREMERIHSLFLSNTEKLDTLMSQ